MTTLYRPVLIESSEQAEALPEGTVANRVLKFESTWETLEQPEVAIKIGRNAWHSTAVDEDAWDWLDRHLVGWTALVPIEAEEETVVDTADLNLDPECEYWSDDPNLLDAVRDAPKRPRLVTAWTRTEEA